MVSHLHKYALCVLLVLALLLQSCGLPGAEQPTPEPVEVKVLLLPFLGFVPYFIAEEEGYFAEQGLEIEFIKMDRTPEAISALAYGELDVAAGLLSVNMLNAIAQGANIKFVADKGYLDPTGCTYTAFMARRSLTEAGELDSPAQLQGRRIAMDSTTIEGYFLTQQLDTAGLTLDDIETVEIPTPTEPEALENGSIDLAATSEPWVTRILQAGHSVVWMPVEQVFPDFQLAVTVYGPKLLNENPDAGKQFMVAYLKAVQQYNQGKTERNLELLSEFTGLDQELLSQTCWPPLRDDGQINVQSVIDFQTWAVEEGLLDSVVTEDQFWDPSFVEHANQVLSTSNP